MSGASVLLSRLEALGVVVVLNEQGDGLKLRAAAPPPTVLLDEVRANKAALLAALVLKESDMLPPLPWEEASDSFRLLLPPARPYDPLPGHLAQLVSRAKAGELLSNPVKLASGLAPDLGVYVLAWAECWPRDRAHVLRRLEEAHAVAANAAPPGSIAGTSDNQEGSDL